MERYSIYKVLITVIGVNLIVVLGLLAYAVYDLGKSTWWMLFSSIIFLAFIILLNLWGLEKLKGKIRGERYIGPFIVTATVFLFAVWVILS